jgi:predicted transcriptional regulator
VNLLQHPSLVPEGQNRYLVSLLTVYLDNSFVILDLNLEFTIHIKQKFDMLIVEEQMPDTINKAKSFILGGEMKTGKHMAQAVKKMSQSFMGRKQMEDKPYRSKLVICIDILCALVSNGAMKFNKLSHKVELDTIRLIPHLKLLIERELVEQQNLGENEIFYSVTGKGLKVLKVVGPMIREAHKIQMRDLETISNTLSEAGYV